MARKRMVTRTITTTKATFLAANLESKTVEEVTIVVSSQMTVDAINKKKDKITPPDGYKLIECTGVTYDEKQYAIPEDKFMEIAREFENKETSNKESGKED